MKRLKKYILGIIMLMVVLSGFSRGPQTETMKDKLSALPGVVSVEKVNDNKSEWMPEKYIVIFEQQLDWNNPEAGTIEQRVEIGLHPDAKVTVMETNGYSLFEDMFIEDDQPEVCDILDANYVQVEHRYMGESYPDEVDNMSAVGWEYATIENEAGDYHHIFEALSTVVDSQWVCYGVSRGGRACLDYAILYPQDGFAGYIPYVGVNPTSDIDPGMTEFLYTEVGNEFYGKEKAAQIRQTILDFQVELMKNKEVLAPLVWDRLQEDNKTYLDDVTQSQIYDAAVFDFAASFWMQAGDVKDIEKVLAIADDNKSEKILAEFNLLLDYGNPSGYSLESSSRPYYFSALLEEGTYGYDFSYIRDALKKMGLEDMLDERDADTKNFFS